MRVRIFALSLAVTALTVVPVTAEELLLGDSVVQSDKDRDCGGCKIEKDCVAQCCCEPLWTFRAGLLVLKQESPSELKEVDFDFEAGIDISAMRRIGECHALEVRYMGIDDWNDRLSLGPLNAAYSSNLHSTEINLRRQYGERINVLAGFRWVELHEEAELNLDRFPILASDVDNHMYGFQLGGEALIWDRGGPLQVTSGVKAGIYYNRADVDVFGWTDKNDHTAFLGEWDMTAKVALTECLALRASYELLWIAGTSTAAAPHGPNVDTSGNHFYHGGIIGVELTR